MGEQPEQQYTVKVKDRLDVALGAQAPEESENTVPMIRADVDRLANTETGCDSRRGSVPANARVFRQGTLRREAARFERADPGDDESARHLDQHARAA